MSHMCEFPDPHKHPKFTCQDCHWRWRYDSTTNQWFRDFS